MSFLGKAMVMKNLEGSAAIRGARNAARSRNVTKHLGLMGRTVNPSFIRGGPLALSGRETFAARRSADATFRNVLRTPPPGRSRFSLAKHGKYVAAGVVGAYGVGAMTRRTGPGVDKTQGRPMGMYGY